MGVPLPNKLNPAGQGATLQPPLGYWIVKFGRLFVSRPVTARIHSTSGASVRMKSYRLAALLLGLVACAGPAGSPGPTAKVDIDAEERAIREADARWMKAFVRHDAAGEAAEYAPDGVEYRPHMEPIIGPAALQAFDTRFFADHPTFAASWTTRSVQISQSADLAISIEDVDIRGLVPTGEGSDKGVGLTVWKKVDGRWKIAHAMFSSIVPEGAASKK